MGCTKPIIATHRDLFTVICWVEDTNATPHGKYVPGAVMKPSRERNLLREGEHAPAWGL